MKPIKAEFSCPNAPIGYLVGFLILMILLFPSGIGQMASIDELEKQIQEKQDQIKELEWQIDIYKDTIKSKRGEQLSLKNQVGILESQIKKLETEVKLIETQISQTNLKIDDSSDKIKNEENNLVEQRGNLEELVRLINEYDEESVVGIFLKNNNFSDFFNQMQYAEGLQEAIQEKVERIRLIKIQLEKERDNYESAKNKLEEFQNNLQAKQQVLGKQRGQKADLLVKTRGEEKRYQKLLDTIIAQKSAFAKELQILEKQILAAKGFAIRVQATQIPPAGTKIFDRPDGVFTQGYGMTEFARRGAYNGAPHNGVDFSSGAGTPVQAAAEGKVIAKGYNRGWGNWVALAHPNYYNLVTLYAHLQSLTTVVIGSSVNRGAVIGYEGSTGFSTGPHLHLSLYSDFFTFLKNDEIYFNYFEGTLNPLNYFK